MTNSGGTSAAFGFSYQYLATATFVLNWLIDNPDLDVDAVVLEVEPPFSGTDPDSPDDDIVDFALHVGGVERFRVQVKASKDPSARTLAPAEAQRVFDRLNAIRHDGESVLLTNRHLGPTMTSACSAPTKNELGLLFFWPGGAASSGPRGRQIAVSHNQRELEAYFEKSIRKVRQDKDLSQGVVSSRMVGTVLRHLIFDAAAGNRDRQISGKEILGTLTIPDARIAHAAGAFDWGNAESQVPNVRSSVPRLDVLDEVGAALEVADRTPPLAVLTGHTGVGKSTVASDYCHLNHNRYETVLWLDARDGGLLRAQIRDYAERLTGRRVDPSANPAGLMAAALASHRGPWLLVFDGAPGRGHIESFIPTIGHGSILVTTTNSTGWWPTARIHEVTSFTSAQALECFAAYADIPPRDIPAVAGTINTIVERLGKIPLAVSMAGLYFRNAQSDLAELVPSYFRTLEALDDTIAIPPGFDRTAFAAVSTAVERIGDGTGSPYIRNARILVMTASFVAPEMIPLNLLIPATTDPLRIDMADLPQPVRAEPAVSRAIITLLRTQTIAHRTVGDASTGGSDLSSDCIQIHPLIHEIVRTKYIADAPEGALMNAMTALFGHLIPWLGVMRTSSSFLALEQLRVHAEAALSYIEELEPLSYVATQQRKVYLTAKAGVIGEVAACYANTARMSQSSELLQKLVVLYLGEFPGEEWAQVFAMKHAADMLSDLSSASVEPHNLHQVAEKTLPMMLHLEQHGTDSTKEMVYANVHLALQSVTHEHQYRSHAGLDQLASGFGEIADRDPKKESRPEWLMRRNNRFIAAGNYQAVLDSLESLRSVIGRVNDMVTLDALEVTALIKTGRLDRAFEKLKVFLAFELVANHVVLSYRDGLGRIAGALRHLESPDDQERAEEYLMRTVGRFTAVEREIQAAQFGQ